MLLGLSCKPAFVFVSTQLIFSRFPLTYFHLAEANLAPRAILKVSDFVL